MARNDSLDIGELTDTSYYILLSLLEAKHGYLIMKNIQELTNDQFTIGPASLYTTIKKLLGAGLIELYGDGGGNKKTYITTDKGIKLLKEDMKRRKQMIEHAQKALQQKGEWN